MALSGGAKAAIIIAVLLVLAGIGVAIWYFFFKGIKPGEPCDPTKDECQSGYFCSKVGSVCIKKGTCMVAPDGETGSDCPNGESCSDGKCTSAFFL